MSASSAGLGCSMATSPVPIRYLSFPILRSRSNPYLLVVLSGFIGSSLLSVFGFRVILLSLQPDRTSSLVRSLLPSALSESAQFSNLSQCDQIRQCIDPSPPQSKRIGLWIEFGNVARKRGDPLRLQHWSQ